MKSLYLESSEKYDGSQLVSLRNYLKHGLLGDSIVAWRGPCDVGGEHMVDGEDLLAGAAIRGDDMLHFIVELFDCSLFAAVGWQRLLASIAKDVIAKKSSEAGLTKELRQDGDDLYCGDRKLSISIATLSPVSALIHFAMNVRNEGTPVKTISLSDFQLGPETVAREIMERFTREVDSGRWATQKVRWVR